jgi:hypothetical protein
MRVILVAVVRFVLLKARLYTRLAQVAFNRHIRAFAGGSPKPH